MRVCGHTFIRRLITPQSIVVDLGVNRGEFAHTMLHRFGCRVYGAEPLPELFRSITPHDRFRVLPVAIAGRTGTAPLYVYRDVCSSIHARPGVVRRDEVPVAVMTLPEFLRHFGLTEIDLLKLDIEGAELEVLASTPDELLRGCKQITVEFHDSLLPETRHAVEQERRRLVSLDFHEIRMSRDNTDVLFVNRRTTPVTWAEHIFLRSVVKYTRGVGRLLKRMVSATAQ